MNKVSSIKILWYLNIILLTVILVVNYYTTGSTLVHFIEKIAGSIGKAVEFFLSIKFADVLESFANQIKLWRTAIKVILLSNYAIATTYLSIKLSLENREARYLLQVPVLMLASPIASVLLPTTLTLASASIIGSKSVYVEGIDAGELKRSTIRLTAVIALITFIGTIAVGSRYFPNASYAGAFLVLLASILITFVPIEDWKNFTSKPTKLSVFSLKDIAVATLIWNTVLAIVVITGVRLFTATSGGAMASGILALLSVPFLVGSFDEILKTCYVGSAKLRRVGKDEEVRVFGKEDFRMAVSKHDILEVFGWRKNEVYVSVAEVMGKTSLSLLFPSEIRDVEVDLCRGIVCVELDDGNVEKIAL